MDKTKTEIGMPIRTDVVMAGSPIPVDPKQVMGKALEAAKVLDEIVSKSQSKSIIVVNGQKYLMFPAWQTLARFNNITAQTDWTKRLEKDGKFIGYDAKAILISLATGQSFPGAEASCLASESKWAGKPEFSLKSMAQTRACSKTLSNMLRWIATLAGYEGTPGEEVDSDTTPYPKNAPSVTTGGERMATAKQLEYIKKSFGWKDLDLIAFIETWKPESEAMETEEEKTELLNQLTIGEAKKMLDILLDKNRTPTLEELLALFGLTGPDVNMG